MGVQLNIKSEEARRLAEEAASLHGMTLDEVVTQALRREVSILRYARSTHEQRAKERENGFFDMIDGARSLWKGAALSLDHGDLLYDEWGLPR